MKKIYISFDFEGIAGVSNWNETMDNFQFNNLATEQLNVFLMGYYEKYPNGEVYISDSHAFGENIIYEKLIGNTYLIKGYPRELYMMQELDSSFDAVVYFGYHSPIGILGNMDHTYSYSSIFDIFINNKKASEICINSLVASYYRVPVKFIYCDSSTEEWIRKNLSSDVKILKSKKVISRYSSVMLPYDLILENLKDAGYNLFEYSDFYYSLSENYRVKIILSDTNAAYTVGIIPFVKKTDGRTIEFVAENPVDLYKKLMTVLWIGASTRR